MIHLSTRLLCPLFLAQFVKLRCFIFAESLSSYTSPLMTFFILIALSVLVLSVVLLLSFFFLGYLNRLKRTHLLTLLFVYSQSHISIAIVTLLKPVFAFLVQVIKILFVVISRVIALIVFLKKVMK